MRLLGRSPPGRGGERWMGLMSPTRGQALYPGQDPISHLQRAENGSTLVTRELPVSLPGWVRAVQY